MQIGADIISIVLGSSVVIAILEWIRYKKIDSAKTTTIEHGNEELAHKNNAIALQTDNLILTTMQSRIEALIVEANKYSNELKIARKEIHELSIKVDELVAENKQLRQELYK
jgi:arginine deiminase